MKRLRPLPARIALVPLLAAGLFAGCTERTIDPDEPTFVRTVVQTSPRTVDIVQGQTFTIEAYNEWSDGTRSGPDLEVFSYPAGLEQVGPIVQGFERTTITVRGVEPLDVTLTLTVGSVPLEDGVPVRVREAGVAILDRPEIFEDEGEKRMVLLPSEQGLTFSIGAVATDDLGCPVPDAADLLSVDVTGDVQGFSLAQPAVGGPVSLPGCPEAANAAVDQAFEWESITPRIGFTYALRGSDRSALLEVAALRRDRYERQTAVGGLAATGTIVRQSTTCGAFQPGTFDFAATLLYDETNGLRIVNPDGSTFQGAEAPVGTWTFTSQPRSLGNGFSVTETILAGEIGYRREGDGGISAIWDGLSRIDYVNEATNTKVCDETATHTVSAPIPRFGFRFRFD